MNTAGFYLRHVIVFAGQSFTYNPLEDFPDAVVGHTNSCLMDSELFITCLKAVFAKALEENSIKRPVVLFVDVHLSHATPVASKFCRENGIIFTVYCNMAAIRCNPVMLLCWVR